jgi:hypothetical protein
MQERLLEIDAVSQIAKEVRDRKSSRLVQQLACRSSAHIVGEPGLVSSESPE